nr:LOW QUALITY PROTEIN: cystatin-B-like [Lytechinus pictus]
MAAEKKRMGGMTGVTSLDNGFVSDEEKNNSGDCLISQQAALLGFFCLGSSGHLYGGKEANGWDDGVTSLDNGLVSDEEKNLIQGLLDKVKPDAEVKAGRKFEELTPVAYATQLVNGVNYFIKANTVALVTKRYVVIRPAQAIRGDVTVRQIQAHKTEADPITYF